MSADLSRVRFDPLRDYSGIGIQQGRLWIDAEVNEQVAITDRRLRAQVVDLAPASTVVSRITPGAFEIAVSGGSMLIGSGRMYVDGLLAENHGPSPIFDPVLAEPNGTGTVDYLKQHYWPTPKALPVTGLHLAYLDVWEREVTHLIAPDLVDSAIGVDTTTRNQIVWQVRLLSDIPANATCDSTIKAWDELTAPSSVRLTTGTVDVDPDDSPCEIPPGKGYRGPEHQLYRVELLSGTQFVWSRDNASVASAVAEVVSASALRLDSLGRDDVLRIKDNDWVEITDDRREFNQLSGEMRQVTVDAASSTITFTPALPNDMVPSTYNLRVRKWDSAPTTIPTDGSAVTLEYGITVSFSFAKTGQPRPGDYWVFAARATAPTPDESLEKLDAAAPRGIHRHYARLALVTMPATVNSDCRPAWPAAGGDGCACEICVTPQAHNQGKFTIQDAIEMLTKTQGGTITLCPGNYRLDSPIKIDHAKSITVRGAGIGSRLVSSGTAVAVSASVDISLERFTVTATGDQPAILLYQSSSDCRLERLDLRQKSGVVIGLDGLHRRLSIQGCQISGGIGIGVTELSEVLAVTLKSYVKATLLTDRLSIVDNVFQCTQRGIDLSGICQHAGQTSIRGNTLRGCSDVGMVVTGSIMLLTGLVESSLEIYRNLVDVSGSGIVTGGRVYIDDNTVHGRTRTADTHGILLDALPPDALDGIAHVLGNKVSGFGGFGISVAAPMRSLIVKQNIVSGAGGGITVSPKTPGGSVAIDNNQILDLKPAGEQGPSLYSAVALAKAQSDDESTVMLPVGAAESGGQVGAAKTVAIPMSSSKAGAVERVAVRARARQQSAAQAVAGQARPAQADAVQAGGAQADAVQAGAAQQGQSVSMSALYRAYLASAAVRELSRAATMFGIVVLGVSSVSIAGNTIDGVAFDEQDSGQTRLAGGIVFFTCGEVRVAGNTLSRIGSPAATAGGAYGIYGVSWQDTVSVSDNIVLSGAGPSPVVRSGWTALYVVGTAAQRIGAIRSVGSTGGTWTFLGDVGYWQRDAFGNVECRGNTFQGGGDDVAVAVATAGDVVMDANRCTQPGTADQQVVRLSAGTAVVQGNRLRGGQPSMAMTVNVDMAVVLGNLTTGGIKINGTDVAGVNKPWSPLNPVG